MYCPWCLKKEKEKREMKIGTQRLAKDIGIEIDPDLEWWWCKQCGETIIRKNPRLEVEGPRTISTIDKKHDFYLPNHYEIIIHTYRDGIAALNYKESFHPSIDKSILEQTVISVDALMKSTGLDFELKTIYDDPITLHLNIQGPVDIIFSAISYEMLARSTLATTTLMEFMLQSLVNKNNPTQEEKIEELLLRLKGMEDVDLIKEKAVGINRMGYYQDYHVRVYEPGKILVNPKKDNNGDANE